MEISVENTKLMTNNADVINRDIRVCGEKLKVVNVTDLNQLDQLSQMKDQKQKFSPELHK